MDYAEYKEHNPDAPRGENCDCYRCQSYRRTFGDLMEEMADE